MSSDIHILLVNSHSNTRALLQKTLSDAGFVSISEASSALSAFQALRSRSIDLIITDIEIAGLDGWRLARLVRSGVFRCKKEIPIIAVAKIWCERIAETTAREFGINRLLPLEDRHHLPEAIRNCIGSAAEAFRNPRVLIIEDDADTALVASRVLRQRFEVDVASDGLEGLEKWKKLRHELVLLDVMLPTLSGPEILHEILQLNPDQPVVIMTARCTVDVAEDLMLKGAADFVSKPFRIEQLRRVCELAVRREDYMVSNAQFASRLQSLQQSTDAFRKISESHQRILDTLSTVVLELDRQGRIRFVNRAWSRLTGFSQLESLDRTLASFIPLDGDGGRHVWESRLDALISEAVHECRFEIRLNNKQEQNLWIECQLDALISDEELTIFGCLDNITERKKAQTQLEFLALHDNMTGLYNRHYFDGALRQMAAISARGKGRHSLLYIDLDHFKVVNDSFGHPYGDAVLRQIAALLASRLRQSDILCRIGGDEFAVLLVNTEPGQDRKVAEEICRLIQNFQSHVGGQQVNLCCSIGISQITGQAASPEEYLKQADIALYVAKRRGRNRIHQYDPEDRESDDLRISVDWIRRLRQAMDEERLLLHFQPIIHVDTGEIGHYEALVRMHLPERGIIYPGEFISALESAGEMPSLDHWVIKKTIALLKQYPELKRAAINLSAQAFRDAALVPLIEEQLGNSGVEPQRIIFELTESAGMSNIGATQQMVRQLNELGCDFAVDDFGTGFSTFGYLKEFPARFIKIDGSFIVQLDRNPVDQALVRSMAEVARALGKLTVAEFVENEKVLGLVRDMGIDFAQGYQIGRPLPIEELFPSAVRTGEIEAGIFK